VRDWTKKQAVRRAVRTSGLLDDPKIVEETERYRDELTVSVLHDRYVFADIEITDEDVRAYYEQHLEEAFTRPSEVRLAHILVESEAEAQDILDRVRAGEDFAAIAREVSLDSATAFHSGRVGWVRPGQILPEVEGPAFALKVGEFDGPIQSEHGYHVIAVLDRRESVVVPFDLAKNAARRRLLMERRRAAHDAWARRLAERADIELLEDGITRAVAWLDAQAARKAEDESETEAAAPLLRVGEAGSARVAPPAPHGTPPEADGEPPGPGLGDSGQERPR
jgi:foldase protein PrsA